MTPNSVNHNSQATDFDESMPAMSLQAFGLLLFAAIAGAFLAILVLPRWLPAMNSSLQGSAPQVFWFLSRSSALVAYVLLWFSMASGLIITNKLARLWPGGPVAFDLHQYTSLLGLAIALFHGLILMGDRYIQFTLAVVFIPFTSAEYRPLWVGLGQVSFYLLAIVSFSFYVRRKITPRVWRLIHYLSFLTYALALVHGIASGTDSTLGWVNSMYWASGGMLLFFFIYRILVITLKPRPQAAKQAS
jgi:predicted ferric reductase